MYRSASTLRMLMMGLLLSIAAAPMSLGLDDYTTTTTTRTKLSQLIRNPIPHAAGPAQVVGAESLSSFPLNSPGLLPVYRYNPEMNAEAEYQYQQQQQSQHWSSPQHQVLTVEFQNDTSSHAAASTPPQYPQSQSASELLDDTIAENVLRFALNIGQQLSFSSSGLSSKTEVFSPLSIMSALSLLMLGAKGKSYQQLSQLFGIDSHGTLRNSPGLFHEEFSQMLKDIQGYRDATTRRNRPNAHWRQTEAKTNIRNTGRIHSETQVNHFIKVANGLFTQDGYGLNHNFRDVVKHVYSSDLDVLDFKNNPSGARDHINKWVDHSTFGKIPQIISGELSRSTNLIIGSALYFKAFWENSFFEMATTDDKFYPDGLQQRAVKVQMMATGGVFPYYDAFEYNCRIIGLPYQGNETTMYVIQPYDSSRAKLRDLQNSLDASKIENMIAKMSRKSAVLAFPKMHMIKSLNLKNLLNQLGVTDVFTSGLADLSLIPDQKPVYNRNITLTPDRRFQAPVSAVREQFAPTIDLQRSHTKAIVYPSSGDIESEQRNKRDVTYNTPALSQLEEERKSLDGFKSVLFVDEVFHKVDIEINEHGTEAAAATLTYLRRSGTDVQFRTETPFMFLIRHDPTKLVLFYGLVNEPELF